MVPNAVARATARLEMRKWLPQMVIVIGLALGPIACSTSNRATTGRVDSASANHAGLSLNEGKKWVLAKPMMVHIRNLEKEVQDFESTPGGDETVLARHIQENLGRFVTNCTMEGKAHEELHKWLMPLLGVSAEYAKATDPRVQQQKRQEIQESLEVFHSYFE